MQRKFLEGHIILDTCECLALRRVTGKLRIRREIYFSYLILLLILDFFMNAYYFIIIIMTIIKSYG